MHFSRMLKKQKWNSSKTTNANISILHTSNIKRRLHNILRERVFRVSGLGNTDFLYFAHISLYTTLIHPISLYVLVRPIQKHILNLNKDFVDTLFLQNQGPFKSFLSHTYKTPLKPIIFHKRVYSYRHIKALLDWQDLDDALYI